MKRLVDAIVATLVATGLAGTPAWCAAADAARWSHTGPNGPAKWGKLDKDFALCATGTTQSPIDIPDAAARKGDIPALLFNYKAVPLKIIDDGHSIQVNYAADSWVSVAGKRHDLIQIRFHRPSEYKIDGKGYDMDAHLVHKDKDGKLATVVVLFTQGKENALIKQLWDNLPQAKGKENLVSAVQVNAIGLLPPNKDYYTFKGSLTEPPCTENVTWYVLKTPSTMSADQIARFARYYPMNARPVQPLNERDILGSR